MPKITQVAQTPLKPQGKKHVAAYARVSTGKDAMLHSLSAQVSYYSALIQRRNDWLYAGVYADEAKTGTKDTRPDFQRMLDDCRAGKIHMVITKSISRFARNTVTLLQTVRELKSWGVDVYFEEQNIHTLSGDGELMMTILASYAQEESRSASENVRWRIRQNFEEGIPCDGTIYGYRLCDGRYEIQPDEAKIVRRIYAEYLSGDGYQVITNRLNVDEVPSRFSGKWQQSTVSQILANATYTGNLILQKTYRENYITKKKLVNHGELPKYLVDDAHEAIIDRQMFEAVQAEKARRAARFLKKKPVKGTVYPFTKLLVCANCGKNYDRKHVSSGPIWICNTYSKLGKAVCPSKRIPEAALQAAAADVLGRDDLTVDFVQSRVKRILVCSGNKLVFQFHDGTETETVWKDHSRSLSWTDEMKDAARQKAIEGRKRNG